MDSVPDGIKEADTARSHLKVDLAYKELKRLIMTLQLAPGSYIDERELMTRLDIGRTPLREAVMRLESDRLISRTPRRGAWVNPLSITDLQQMIEARSYIDGWTARRAAERITDAEIEELEQYLQKGTDSLAERDDIDLVDQDFQLHALIARISANDYLATFSRQLNSEMLRYWNLASQNTSALESWHDRHRALVDAIASRDPDLAEAQARRHVKHFRDNLRNLIG